MASTLFMLQNRALIFEPSEVDGLRRELKALEDLLPYLKEERRARVHKLMGEVQHQLSEAEARFSAPVQVVRLRRVK